MPTPILTPTTKAESGHDLDISFENIVRKKLIKKSELLKLKAYALELFEFGSQYAASQGLILVDTKYEFGTNDDVITLIDEIHTPDSSRYFYADTYQKNKEAGIEQKQLSKEFVRQWLISEGFQGLEGQLIPHMSAELVENVSNRYIELYEIRTGKKLIKHCYSTIECYIEESVNNCI